MLLGWVQIIKKNRGGFGIIEKSLNLISIYCLIVFKFSIEYFLLNIILANYQKSLLSVLNMTLKLRIKMAFNMNGSSFFVHVFFLWFLHLFCFIFFFQKVAFVFFCSSFFFMFFFFGFFMFFFSANFKCEPKEQHLYLAQNK